MASIEDFADSKSVEGNDNDNPIVSKSKKRKTKLAKEIKVLSILMILFSVLYMLAMISYTRSDNTLAQGSMMDFWDLLWGDELVKLKASSLDNFLGLLGAKIANSSFNRFFGISMLLFPVLIFVWGIDLFKYNYPTANTLRNTYYIIFSILSLSFLLATIRLSGFFDLPLELSGLGGDYIAYLFSSFSGVLGAFLFALAANLILAYYITNFNLEKILKRINGKLDFGAYGEYLSQIFSKFKQVASEKKVGAEAETDLKIVNQAKSEQNAIIEKEIELEQINEVQAVEEIPPVNEIIDGVEIVRNPSTKSFEEVKQSIPRFAPSKLKITSSSNNTNIAKEKPQIPIEIKTNVSEVLSIPTTEKPKFIVSTNSHDEDADTAKENVKEIESYAEPIIKTVADTAIVKEREIDESIDNLKIDSLEKQKQKIETELKSQIDEAILSEFDSFINEVESAEIANKQYEPSYVPKVDVVEQNNEIVEQTVHIEPTPTPHIVDKRLTVTVNEIQREEYRVPENMLSTNIHDEEINYIPPGLDLLNNNNKQNAVNNEELSMNGRILQEKLETFKIQIENLSVTPGPVVTQYEFVPAAGIKISRIESLADDLAMALKAKGIRIIAPIPGKGTVGVEIPNLNPSLVRFSSLIASKEFNESESFLPLALGKTIPGDVEITDLAKMPHLLIAGSTGSGKSVGVNTFICSLLYKKHPSELKFVIIDPKKVEMAQYSRLKNHFMATSPDVSELIITNPVDAVSILKSTVVEMEARYDILAKVGQRNIADYNQKVKDGKIKTNEDMVHKPIPYIVVIIDELADLMLTASKEIEEPIIRLAQKSRAVGIHLILATQRPSVDVITGIIKANFPARISYLVASKVDSRTVLDASGAEKLLGNGDMLFLPSNRPKAERIQNSYLSTDEVDAICDHIGNQKGYSMPYMLPSINEDNKSSTGGFDAEDREDKFDEAARMVVRYKQASASFLQRKLSIGYARAGRLMDQLEGAGIVGPADGSKARTVLYDSEADLERIL